MISYSECYSLPLGFKLYGEMMENYERSLERKRADSTFFEDYGLTKQQRWVNNVLKKEDLEKMLLVLSPNYIANRLELSITAIKWLIKKVHRLKIRKNGRKYYNTINKSIYSEGKNSVYYDEWSYWDAYLKNLEKFKKD
jgi:hypothetical protein